MSAGWNFTQVTSGAVHTSDNNQATSNENGLNQVTPGGAPANNFTLPASLNMHQVQVSRQFTMGAGSLGNSADQDLQLTRGVWYNGNRSRSSTKFNYTKSSNT